MDAELTIPESCHERKASRVGISAVQGRVQYFIVCEAQATVEKKLPGVCHLDTGSDPTRFLPPSGLRKE